MEREITKTEEFRLGEDKIEVNYSDLSSGFAFRMWVNGNVGPWETYYRGVYVWEGYGLAMPYWDGFLPTLVPFKITAAEQV